MNNKKTGYVKNGTRYILTDPKLVPKADTFLWNNKMLCHVNAEGYVQTQFRQPEPCFYSHAPMMAAQAAMAPEPQYFEHHPGRFFYVKNEETGEFYSAPSRPANVPLDEFEFSPGLSDVQWVTMKNGIETKLQFAIPFGDDIVELWKVTVTNSSNEEKKISLYPYFPIGFPSWMNTEGAYDSEIGGMLAYTLTPYRKLEDYYKIKNFKDYTYLLCDQKETGWSANLNDFEGDGGLRCPDGIMGETLDNMEAAYETTACIMQYRRTLKPGESVTYNFVFGPANSKDEINGVKEKYLGNGHIEKVIKEFDLFYKENSGCIQIKTKDETLNNFINNWLPRQILYHSYNLRMVTDPQTRNFIQDAMGMIYLDPDKAKEQYIFGLKQQKSSGEMQDGILLIPEAEFKYTNQIPHRDHSVWWAYAVHAYVEETGDYDFLNEPVEFEDSAEKATVYEHVVRGIEWLVLARSERGLCYIGQGDWNDPMNMVGHKGKGESVWLTQAMIYAMRIWLPMCERVGDDKRIQSFTKIMNEVDELLNTVCWDGEWYARGFSDDGIKVGGASNDEGKIFLNAQSFGILSGAPGKTQIEKIIHSVHERLDTPYGLLMLAPSFTYMNEKIGRLTQKHPSTAENGSVYCHANAFYAYALLDNDYGEEAYQILRKLIPGPDYDDMHQREHLPLYLPNYYRGDHNPRVLGKASHLMNTGSLPWYYRCFVEGIFGLKGTEEGLIIKPELPRELGDVKLERTFRGKKLNITYHRIETCSKIEVILNGDKLEDNFISKKQLTEENVIIINLPA